MLTNTVLRNRILQLSEGVSKVRGFIHSIPYTVDDAIIDSAKIAYLATGLQKGLTIFEKYNSSKKADLMNAVIKAPMNTKLNKLKKTNIEAFFYWYKTSQLMN